MTDLNHRHVRWFRALARKGSITAAADALGIAASTVRTRLARGLPLCAAILAGCDGTPVSPELEGEVAAFVELMNAHRVQVGCEPLAWSADVAGVAEAHSRDMRDRSFFAHTNPDGASPADRLRAAGIDYRRMAENIAWGYPSGEAVLTGWLESSGHRANIENCQLEEHGVGLAGTHWTHVFVTR